MFGGFMFRTIFLVILCSLLTEISFAAPVSIQNAFLRVTADEKQVVFTRGGETVPFASFSLNSIPEKMPGNGISLPTIFQGMDAAWEIILPEKSPFAQMTFSFRTSREINVVEIPFPEITLAKSFVPGEHKALGTAGLTAVDGHPGSYMFLAVAHPETRAGVVISWLTSTRGSGVVFSDVKENAIRVRAVDQYGRWVIPVGVDCVSEPLLVGAFSDARLGLEAYAEEVAKTLKIRLKPAPCGYCTWYSDRNGGSGNEASTQVFANTAAAELARYGFRFFQIDDGWQSGDSKNGPNKNFTIYRQQGPYTSGMKQTADYLAEKGFLAGLWFMPFSGNYDDPYYEDKQAWFVKSAVTYPEPGQKNTRRYSINQRRGAAYETFWGGTALDMTHPEVQEYLTKEVDRIANWWGYKYFKTDGMWVGMACEQLYVNDGYAPDDLGKQIFFNPGVTNVEAYREGCRLVRDAAGDDVFILGCNVSQNMRTLGASYGAVDAMRIGPDNGPDWGGICAGPVRGTARYFLNARVWWNDPDPVYVRDSIPLEHARLIASWAAITGQLYAFSDWLPGLSAERVEVIRRTIPNHQRKNVRPVDLFNSQLANVWHLEEGEYHILGIFNWRNDKPLPVNYTAGFLGLKDDKTYVGYDFWRNVFLPPLKGNLACELPAATCRVISLREINDIPVLVGTSRHVASPILDMTGETWREDGETGVLSGTSTVVAGEDYELRVVVPVGKESWESVRETADNVKSINAAVNGNTVRVRIVPETSGKVRWKLTFQRAAVKAPELVPPKNAGAKIDYGRVTLTWDDTAVGYVVERNDKKIFLEVPEFTDSGVKAGTNYAYKIYARGWGEELSAPVSLTVTTLPPLVIPAVPPAPQVHISDLEPLRTQGDVRKNVAHKGTPLTILGTVYEKGLGVHANSHLVYRVPEGHKRFVATVGIDDAEKDDPRRSIQAKVYVAGKDGPPILVGESPIMRNDTVQIWHFDFSLNEDSDEIYLEVNDAGDGIACDHGNWVNAGFRKK